MPKIKRLLRPGEGSMERNQQPIGVFDSGVGGLTVVAKLRMLLPH